MIRTSEVLPPAQQDAQPPTSFHGYARAFAEASPNLVRETGWRMAPAQGAERNAPCARRSRRRARLERTTGRDLTDMRRAFLGRKPCSGGPRRLARLSTAVDLLSTDRHRALNTFSTAISTSALRLRRFGGVDRIAEAGPAEPKDGNPLPAKSSSFQERLLSARTSPLRDIMTLRPSPSAPPPEAVSAWDGVSVQSDDPLPGRFARPVNSRARSALTPRFRPDADPVPPSSRGERRFESQLGNRVDAERSTLAARSSLRSIRRVQRCCFRTALRATPSGETSLDRGRVSNRAPIARPSTAGRATARDGARRSTTPL
jgi:hypothetical protein